MAEGALPQTGKWLWRPKAPAKGLKALERFGRRLLVRCVSAVLGCRRQAVAALDRPRLLVLRFDARLGNLVLLTPVLQTLKARYPQSTIDVLGGRRGAAVLASHPAVDRYEIYDKAALLGATGPLRTLRRLRRRSYDVCLDLSNPTDPSVTQALIARLSGAAATIGSAASGFDRLFTAPVSISGCGPHEIDLRLALLGPLRPGPLVRQVALGPLPVADDAAIVSFVRTRLQGPYAVVNIGARLAEKRLSPADYAAIAYAINNQGLRPVLTFGPKEVCLAKQVAHLMPGAVLAPETNVAELAFVMKGAACIVSCDTGPMHLAAALGRPTCGLFVSTSMARFGYGEAPHACVEVEGRKAAAWMPQVRQFLQVVAPASPQDALRRRS